MAKNVTVQGASYTGVPALELPQTGGGTARFTDTSGVTALVSDVTSGKTFVDANGILQTGTASGGGGGTNYYAWRDSMGYVHFSDSAPTKTHYVIAVSQPSLVVVPIFDETISNWSEEQSDPVPVYYSDIEVDEHLTAGQQYTVTFDNVEYQLTAYVNPDSGESVCLGEYLWEWDGTSPVSAPFLFSVTNEAGEYWGYVAVLSDASHAIRVEEAT